MSGAKPSSPIDRALLAIVILFSGVVPHLAAQVSPNGDPELTITSIEGPKTDHVMIGDATAWFLTKEGLVKLDRQHNQLTAAVPIEKIKRVGFAFGVVAIGGGSYWAYGKAHEVEGIHRIDLSTGKCTAVIALKPRKGENSLMYGEGALWVLNLHDGNLKRIDVATNQVSAEIELGKGFWQPLKIADGLIWALADESGLIKRIDPTSNKVVDEFSIGDPQKNGFFSMPFKGGTYYVSVGDRMLWVADKKTPSASDWKYTLVRIDTRTHEQIAKLELGDCDCGPPVIWNGNVWFSEMYRQGDLIRKINSKTAKIERQFSFPPVEAGKRGIFSVGARWLQANLIADGDTLWAISLPGLIGQPAIVRRIQANATDTQENKK